MTFTIRGHRAGDRGQITDTILEFKRAGMSILLCEQNLQFARRVADRAYLI